MGLRQAVIGNTTVEEIQFAGERKTVVVYPTSSQNFFYGEQFHGSFVQAVKEELRKDIHDQAVEEASKIREIHSSPSIAVSDT